MNRAQVAAWVGSVAVLVGAFLPWATVRAGLFSLSVSGVENGGDGRFTAGAAALVMLLLLVGGGVSRPVSIVAPIAGLLSTGVVWYDYSRLTDRASADVVVSPGIGLVLTGLGGVALIAVAILDRNARPAPAAAAVEWPPPPPA